MGDYSGGGGGITPPAGDIGGTTASPTVVDTHLTSPLPLAQGGTGVDAETTSITLSPSVPVCLICNPPNHAGEIEFGYLGSIAGNMYGTANNGIAISDKASYRTLGINSSTSLTYTVGATTYISFDETTSVVSIYRNKTLSPSYTSLAVTSGTAVQVSTDEDAIISLDVTYSTTAANTIVIGTGATAADAALATNQVYKKVKTTSTAEEDTIMVDVKAGEYLLVTLTNATFTNATQVVKLV